MTQATLIPNRCFTVADAQDRLLSRDKTCPARTYLIMSWKVNLTLLVLLWQGVKEAQRQGGALTIKHTTGRKGKGPPGGGKAGPLGSDLERKVVNCLCCGKVYDFRLAGAGQLTNDLLRFLGESGQQSLHIMFCCHISMELCQVTL